MLSLLSRRMTVIFVHLGELLIVDLAVSVSVEQREGLLESLYVRVLLVCLSHGRRDTITGFSVNYLPLILNGLLSLWTFRTVNPSVLATLCKIKMTS